MFGRVDRWVHPGRTAGLGHYYSRVDERVFLVEPANDNLHARVSAQAVVPHRSLTPVEMEHRRAQGLCYQCDEKYFVGHRCKRLFVIKIHLDFGDDDDQENLPATNIEPEISLDALTGI